jgi:hypothetical protein
VGSSARIAILKSCSDLREEDFDAAVERRPHFIALLAQLAEVSDPGQDGLRVVQLLARVSTAMWLDGEMRVEILADGKRSVFELLTELGGGLRERVCAPVTLRLPLAELIEAIKAGEDAIEPLKLKSSSPRRVVLVVGDEGPKSTMPPPMVKVKGDKGTDRPPPATNVAPPRTPREFSIRKKPPRP